MKLLLTACLFLSACSYITREEVERRFVLKSDLDNLVLQANQVLGAQAGAIKTLQEAQPKKK